MRGALEAAGFTVDSAELTMVPKTTVEVVDENEAKKILRLIDTLEDNDDVQDVFANFDIQWLTPIIGFMLIAASLGGMLTWLAGPSKGLLVVAREMREHGRHAIWVASDLLRGEKT